jgi:NhaP-type Na+/H+ or K+/H+ antiporter
MHSDFLFRLLAFLAEMVIFLELGLSVFRLTGSFHLTFTAWALLACLVGRAFNVYPITWSHNWTIRRKSGIDRQHSDDIRDRPAQIIASTHKTESSSLLENGRPEIFTGELSQKSLKKMLYMSERTPLECGDLKILPNCAHMLWFAGLRGAVAYACVRTFRNIHHHHDIFVMTTMMIVLVTVGRDIPGAVDCA